MLDTKELLLELRKIGFSSLQQFLDSKHWESLTSEILSRDFFWCIFCGDEADRIYPLNWYASTLAGAKPHWLISICTRCLDESVLGIKYTNIPEYQAILLSQLLFEDVFGNCIVGEPGYNRIINNNIGRAVAKNFSLANRLSHKYRDLIALAESNRNKTENELC